MKIKSKNQFLTMTALLTALAIAIPMVMPLKIVIPPCFLYVGEPRRHLSGYVYLASNDCDCHFRIYLWFFDSWLSICNCPTCFLSYCIRYPWGYLLEESSRNLK